MAEISVQKMQLWIFYSDLQQSWLQISYVHNQKFAPLVYLFCLGLLHKEIEGA